ncbi:hypothetical protein [Flagellimonas onchidii]|uniref:hypothetical protein n=1 Tax=Flagellimonas onchidii TaxID=2562684 RepID=UPI0010A5D005|nr:hypothetical protein [Allomuricauda onchidii]
MRKLSCWIAVLLLMAACKNKDGVSEDVPEQELIFNYQKMPKKIGLDSTATALSEDWAEFKAFTGSFDVLYKAKNNEDLILAIDDLIEKEKFLAESTYPGILNDLQIKSRQRVLKTYFLKVKASILNNQDTTEPTVEMLEAYNIFLNQFKVVVNSQLDKKLILDEE